MSLPRWMRKVRAEWVRGNGNVQVVENARLVEIESHRLALVARDGKQIVVFDEPAFELTDESVAETLHLMNGNTSATVHRMGGCACGKTAVYERPAADRGDER